MSADKIALITDTHCGVRGGNSIIEKHQLSFYDDVFFPYLEDNKIDTIVHLGDVFDNRKMVNVRCAQNLRKHVIERLHTYDVHVLIGNHDAYFKNTNRVNSVYEFLKGYSIRMYVDPTETLINGKPFLMLPWITDDNRQATVDMIKKTTAKVAFGHLELKGYYMSAKHIAMHGDDPSMLEKFDRVFSGHYHEPSTRDNVTYLGSPFELTWEDAGRLRGFHIYDTDNDELDFVPNPHTVFHQFVYNDEHLEIPNLEEKYVRVIVEECTDQKKLDSFLSKIEMESPHEVRVHYTNKLGISDRPISYENIGSTMDYIHAEIDNMELSNTDEVKNIMNVLYKEASNL